jgi:hypothetical protein
MATDRLSLANALEAANMDRPAAERIATEIYDAIHNNVATKADVAVVRADLAQLRAELGARIDLVEHRLLTRLGGVIVVVAGLVFGALRLWPPHL